MYKIHIETMKGVSDPKMQRLDFKSWFFIMVWLKWCTFGDGRSLNILASRKTAHLTQFTPNMRESTYARLREAMRTRAQSAEFRSRPWPMHECARSDRPARFIALCFSLHAAWPQTRAPLNHGRVLRFLEEWLHEKLIYVYDCLEYTSLLSLNMQIFWIRRISNAQVKLHTNWRKVSILAQIVSSNRYKVHERETATQQLKFS